MPSNRSGAPTTPCASRTSSASVSQRTVTFTPRESTKTAPPSSAASEASTKRAAIVGCSASPGAHTQLYALALPAAELAYAGHATHALAPASAEYVPAAHGAHIAPELAPAEA